MIAPRDDQPDLTLLLVHGIGRQRPGSVVEQAGNALLDWFQTRLAGSGRRVEIERAMLKPAARGEAGPARATLVVRDAAGAPERRVRLVESLWAEEFDPPGFFGVLRWTLGPGTWLLLSHVATMPQRLFRRRPPRARRRSDASRQLASVLGAVALFALVLPAQVLGILLAILWLVPLGPVRRFVESVVLILSELIGDSYLFTQNLVVRRALADRVHRDLDAALGAGAPVAILAHSQGAAVAFDMLERHPDPPPLVTYGAGIRKLHELVPDQAGLPSVPWVFRVLWAVAVLWSVALAGVVLDVRRALEGVVVVDQIAGMAWLVVFALFVAGYALGWTAWDRRLEVDEHLSARIRRHLARQPAWLDLFASHDVVPAGPLVAEAGYARRGRFWRTPLAGSLDSLAIVNRMDTVLDHTSYWSNLDGFIDPLAEWLSRELRLPWLPSAPASAPIDRRWRMRARKAIETMLLVEVVALWWRARDVWSGLLPGADTAADAAVAFLPTLLVSFDSAVRALVGVSFGVVSLATALAVHLGALALYTALVPGPIWRGLDRQLAKGQTRGRRNLVLLGLRLTAFVGLTALAAVILWLGLRDASYRPLLLPWEAWVEFHRAFFVGNLPELLER
jgi:hypothetical protein